MGAIYYTIHDMLVKTALFLIIGVMYQITKTSNLKSFGGLITLSYTWLVFLYCSFKLGWYSPFSGFYGKYFIVKAAFEKGFYISAIIVLLSSLIVLYSVIRIFLMVLVNLGYKMNNNVKKQATIVSVIAVIITVLFGLSADALYPFISEAANLSMIQCLY